MIGSVHWIYAVFTKKERYMNVAGIPETRNYAGTVDI